MDWSPPPAKYSTQEKQSPRSRFSKLLPPSLEEQMQLEALGAIESDNNPAAEHQTIRDPSSIHTGTSAVGEYGIMPNTARDILKEASKEETMGAEMANTNPFTIEEDMKHNTALQNELALNYLRKIRDIQGGEVKEDQLPAKWIQGASRKVQPKDLLQHNRNSKYNESKLENLKKLFSK